MSRGYRLIVVFTLVFLTGCASITARRIPVFLDRPADCQEFLDRLDESVKAAGVRDASSFPVSGFPYLRANRFFAALKESLKKDDEKNQWVREMRELDLESRRKEVRNLPDGAIAAFPIGDANTPQRDQILSRAEACSSELLTHDRKQAEFYATLVPQVRVPDEYSLALRTVGLYPIAALPVAAVSHRALKRITSWFTGSLEDLPVDGELRQYAPREEDPPDPDAIRKLMEASRRNPLEIPLPDASQRERLARSFAPVFIQDIEGSYDRMGRVMWEDGRPAVDPERPTVYYYLTHAYLKKEPVLQINYVIWYSARAGKRAPPIERGHLDGLTIRISLDETGRIFMVEGMNNCGCYHLFVPDGARIEKILARPMQIDPFVPQELPATSTDQRLGIRINSGWHQVQRMTAVGKSDSPARYELLPYDILESLPRGDGRTESLFDRSGIAKGSGRIERFILFSMGIPSVGSMRQRGHHAIELIGRLHFDDPHLFNKSFEFK